MKQTDNLEQLFRDSLGNLESDVHPRVWENIQNQLSSGTGSNSGLLGSLMSKVIVGVLGTAAVVTAVVVLNTGEETPGKDLQKPVHVSEQTSTSQKVTNDHKSSTTVHTPSNTSSSLEQTQVSVSMDAAPEMKENPVPPSLPEKKETPSNQDVNQPKDQNPPVVTPSKSDPVNPPAPEKKLNELPLFKMIINYNQEFAPAVFTFANNGSGEVISWDFGDNTEVSTDASPNHLYEKPGDYVVTMTVRDANGNTHEQNKTIKVKEDPNANEPLIPNSFTPNGDGINDEFRVTDNVNIVTFSIVIQDKNGKIVSQWSGFEGYWDGRNLKGEICPPGTYIYVLKYEDRSGEKRQKIGSITIPNQR